MNELINKAAAEYMRDLETEINLASEKVFGRVLSPKEISMSRCSGIGTFYFNHETAQCFFFEAEMEVENNHLILKGCVVKS